MRNKQYITVFGATGKIGSELIQLLSQAQIPVIAVTRNKNKAINLPFVEWMEADMNDKDRLNHTMVNSKAAFLISGASENILREQCNVIDVAAAEGVSHIVKLSSAMADSQSSLFIARVHGQIEEYLVASGIAGTMLRPTGFMQNWLLGLANTVKSQRKIYEATGDGKRAYIDLRDIAEAAFKVLTEPDKHACHAYLLTGSEVVNYSQLAAMITGVIGEEVSYVPISAETAKQQMEQKGMPDWAIETFLSYAEDQRNHKAAYVSRDVPDILQKPARTVAAFIDEYGERFK
jgi:uncharacterized protein YbjT (DUF2867 family)